MSEVDKILAELYKLRDQAEKLNTDEQTVYEIQHMLMNVAVKVRESKEKKRIYLVSAISF